MAAAHPLSPSPGSRAADLAGLLARLWSLVLSPEWAERPSFLEAVQKAGMVNALVRRGQAPRAADEAALLGKALERIARGKWPRSERSRAFLADCIRAVALTCGVSPFWKDEKDTFLIPDEELLEEVFEEPAAAAPPEPEASPRSLAASASKPPAALAPGPRPEVAVEIERPIDPDELLVLVLAANGDKSDSCRKLFRAAAARRRRAFPLLAARRLSCARPSALGQAKARARRRRFL